MVQKVIYLQSGGLSGTGLSLGDDILALDDGHDSSLLDGRRALETAQIGKSKKSDRLPGRVAKFCQASATGGKIDIPVL